MSFAGPIGCPEGGTGLCPGLQDSSLGCVGKLAVTSMVRMGVFVGGGGGGGGGAKSVVSTAI